ncbi:MAG: FdhF/YdeP family oxidoreductase [Dehalococcoidia bacterium]
MNGSTQRIRSPRRLKRDLWVGFKPYGIGETKPNHYGEIVRTIWENRRAPLRAWRILRKGVCDGCALGVAGLHDWTIDGVHLCSTRLNLLRLNTMGPFDPAVLADVQSLRDRSGAELRELGRLAYPMLRRRGQPGFTRISWDEALDLAAAKLRDSDPRRVAFYLTARGITNEVYYVAQKAARLIGTPNIDNAARVCHAPSTATLKQAIGVGATTISYRDAIETDLIVLFGSHVANAQPVFMKYLYLARKRGTKVAVVNPYREPALERYWVPSNVESAMFGTRMTDEFFQVHTGGDVAFLNGVLKVMLDQGLVDRDFIDGHSTGFDLLVTELGDQPFEQLERISGAQRADMERFARMYGEARSAVFVWSMGITQHATGSDNVRAIINTALARGNVGRPGAGLMPIRGHSGVQGGAEMGAYATALPGGVPVDSKSAAALSQQYGFDVPSEPGMSAQQMLEAALQGELDVLYSSGGNFLDVLPDPKASERALARVPLRVHQDIVLSSQMLVDPDEDAEAVLLLPAATRYEQRDGGTETTTERRIAFSPQIERRPRGQARSEWQIFMELAQRVDPQRAHLIDFESGWAIREEIAQVVPFYEGIETLRETGDQVQWGGARLCDGWRFETDDGKAHFVSVVPRELNLPEGKFLLSSRRGKQFNSMVFKKRDPLTGASRDALFISYQDADRLGLAERDAVTVRSDVGERRATVKLAAIRPGNVQAFFPEANVLIAPGVRDGASGVPDYNALVEVVPLAEGGGRSELEQLEELEELKGQPRRSDSRS